LIPGARKEFDTNHPAVIWNVFNPVYYGPHEAQMMMATQDWASVALSQYVVMVRDVMGVGSNSVYHRGQLAGTYSSKDGLRPHSRVMAHCLRRVFPEAQINYGS
jgi:hypothetical protein